MNGCRQDRITQHMRLGFALPFGTLLPLIATSYKLGTLHAMPCLKNIR